MSALAEERWAIDPEPVSGGAMAAPRCRCRGIRLVADDLLCCRCGREIREESAMSRELRKAEYMAALQWARGEGLDGRTGFRGLSDELGQNPPLEELQEALCARLAALPAPEALLAA